MAGLILGACLLLLCCFSDSAPLTVRAFYQAEGVMVVDREVLNLDLESSLTWTFVDVVGMARLAHVW